MAIIESRRRGASVVALTECNLLELKADDFRRLMAEHESIQEAMARVAEIRRSQDKGQSGKERV
jgi:CRP-like cAMP-binding protein